MVYSFMDDALLHVGMRHLDPPYGPVAVSDVELAFSAHVGHLMPRPHDIPKGYWSSHLGDQGERQWVDLADRWFARGLSSGVEFHMNEGFDGETCWRHLMAIMASFAPKHEHKVASVAFLMSVWMCGVVDDGTVYGSPRTTRKEEPTNEGEAMNIGTASSLEFGEYQRKAADTAIYPGSGTGSAVALSYVTLGLTGEAGEIANKVKKIMRDDEGIVTDAKRLAIAAELGDVLWYLSQLARELGVSLADLADENLSKLAGRKLAGRLKGEGDLR